MTRIIYIARPGGIGSTNTEAQRELDAFVAAEAYNFYGGALAYAQANTTEQLGLYGGLAMTADQFEAAQNIKAAAGDLLLASYARQTEIAQLDGVAATWGIDPALADLVESGTIGPGIYGPAANRPEIGLVISGTVLLVTLVSAAVVGAIVTAGILNTIHNNRLAADVSAERTRELTELAGMLPTDEARARLYQEVDRQVKNTYRAGLRTSLFSGFSGTAIGLAIMGLTAAYIYNRAKK